MSFLKLSVTVQDQGLTLKQSDQKGTDHVFHFPGWPLKLDEQLLAHYKAQGLDIESEEDGLAITIPPHLGGPLSLNTASDRTIQIHAGDPSLELNIQSTSAVHLNPGFVAQKLSLEAREVFILESLQVESLDLKSQYPLKNYATIIAKNVELRAAAFHNYGSIKAEIFYARAMQGDVENHGSVSAESHLEFRAGQGQIRNAPFAPLCSAGRVQLFAQEGLNNAGLIAGKGVFAESFKAFTNTSTGKIQGQMTCKLGSTRGVLENLGKISSQTDVNVCGDKIINGPQAAIHSHGRAEWATGTCLENSGEIIAKEEIKGITGHGIVNHKSGVIFSGHRAYVNSVRGLQNAGQMGARIWLDVNVGELETQAGSVLASKGYNRLCILGPVNNWGEIMAGHFLSVEAQGILNQKAGQIISYQNASFGSGLVNNWGKMAARAGLEVKGAHQVHNHETGTLLGKQLQIQAEAIHNEASAQRQLLSILQLLVHFGEPLALRHLARGAVLALLKPEVASAQQKIHLSELAALLKDFKEEHLYTTAFHQTDLPRLQAWALGKAPAPDQALLDQALVLAGTTPRDAGLIAAEQRLHLNSDVIRNQGFIFSQGELSLVARAKLENLLGAYVLAFGKSSLWSQSVLLNAGSLVSRNESLFSSPVIENALGGKVLAQSLEAQCKQFKNHAELQSHHLVLKVKDTLENYVQGKITAGQALQVLGGRLMNAGLIESLGSLDLAFQDALENQASGRIKAIDSLKMVCCAVIQNLGKIESFGPLCLSAEQILQDLSQGQMVSLSALELIAKMGIENAGLLSGKNLSFKTGAATEWLNSLKTAGLFTADTSSESVPSTLTLKSQSIFKNLASGTLTATESLNLLTGTAENLGQILAGKSKIKTDFDFNNKGILKIKGALSLEAAGTLRLFREGKIKVGQTLELLSAQKIHTEADIVAFENLALIAPQVEHAAGTIKAHQDLILQATDWLLAGQVQAGVDLLVKVKQQFDWQLSGQFEAQRRTQLELEAGYTFTRPIAAPGSLAFACLPQSTFSNQTQISAGVDLAVNGGAVVNGRMGTPQTTVTAQGISNVIEGGQFAKFSAGGRFESQTQHFDNVQGSVYGAQGLTIKAEAGIVVGRGAQGKRWAQHWGQTQPHDHAFGNGSYLASGADMNLETHTGNIQNNLSSIDAGQNLALKAPQGQVLNEAGEIRSGRNLTVDAKALVHQLKMENISERERRYTAAYALSNRPVLMAARDMDLNAAVTALGGDIHAAGSLTQTKGSVKAQAVEEFEHKVHHFIGSYKTRHGAFGNRTTKHEYVIRTPEKRLYKHYTANISGGRAVSNCPIQKPSMNCRPYTVRAPFRHNSKASIWVLQLPFGFYRCKASC